MLRYVFISLLTFLIFSSCHEKVGRPNQDFTLDAFSKFGDERFRFDIHEIRKNIVRLIDEDNVRADIKRQVRKYYLDGNSFIWIDRNGIYRRADSLFSVISMASKYGLSERMIRIFQIGKDLELMHNLDVDGTENKINAVAARLEYNLTRAYFCYSSYIRFGIINPDYFYNNLEKYEVDSVTTKFRRLSELHVERPDSAFYALAVTKAFNDSVCEFVATLHPRNKLYYKLLERLNDKRLSNENRFKVLCNIERCRWRLKNLSGKAAFSRYAEVNIPSFSLRAINGDNVLQMRVGCGTLKNKTPLLFSQITRMDINPQWIVPKSISKGFIGDFAYMHRMGMFVFDKKKGKLPPEQIEYEKVMNGEQYVVQAGGPKNSLGRIIFRFDNSFSVFLHDTSSPWIFQRERRAVSHGCVRVEKPYEFAKFLLGDIDEKTDEKLKYSMTVKLVNDNDSLKKRNIDKKKLINSLYVKPSVPLFISYYTIYYGNDSQLVDYQDVYGYDEALAEHLKPYME